MEPVLVNGLNPALGSKRVWSMLLRLYPTLTFATSSGKIAYSAEKLASRDFDFETLERSI
ncbi:hypothetical protein D3C73_1003410 [compost metagenome]